jgi:hypothetical protein
VCGYAISIIISALTLHWLHFFRCKYIPIGKPSTISIPFMINTELEYFRHTSTEIALSNDLFFSCLPDINLSERHIMLSECSNHCAPEIGAFVFVPFGLWPGLSLCVWRVSEAWARRVTALCFRLSTERRSPTPEAFRTGHRWISRTTPSSTWRYASHQYWQIPHRVPLLP